jgi:DnaK suppressor protein
MEREPGLTGHDVAAGLPLALRRRWRSDGSTHRETWTMMNGDAELTAEQVEELRRELHRMRARLHRSMGISEQRSKPVTLDQTSVGRLSRMDALQNQGITQGLQAREAATLARVEEALARLERGEYGRCPSCERRIPYDRLLVFPEAATCAACASGE